MSEIIVSIDGLLRLTKDVKAAPLRKTQDW